MEPKIFHTVNNGFYLLYGDDGIFFDGIHLGSKYGFSDTPDEIIDKCYGLESPFENLKALFFTHKHADHFDGPHAEIIAKRNRLYLYAPKCASSNVGEKAVKEDIVEMNVGEVQIFAFKTIHDGAKNLQKEPHVSFAVNAGENSYLVAGDAAFRAEMLDNVGEFFMKEVAAVFVNPYQIISSGGRDFINSLSPKKTVIAHIPFEKDDAYNVKALVDAAIKQSVNLKSDVIIPSYNDWVKL